MKIDEIMKLIDAGFTKEEIIALSTPAQAPDPEEKEVETEEPEKAPAISEYTTALNGILDSFKAVAKEIKAANIANSKLQDEKVESAEETLMKVISAEKKG